MSRSPHPSNSHGTRSPASGSGSGSGGPPKANFKHSLSAQISLNYFTEIRKRLEDAGSDVSRRRRQQQNVSAASMVYEGEDAQVCQDMIEACRLLESAPLDFKVDPNPTAPAGGATTLKRQNSGSRWSGTPPLSPSPAPQAASAAKPSVSPLSVSLPGMISLSQGRTSDGQYGLNHFAPQKDAHNGPCQAFLENDCNTLGMVSSWQAWAEARTKFFDEAGPLAAEVFTFAATDETIVSVSPSTPTTGGSSRTSPSTPFRRSPRPDYEAKLQEIQSKYVRIGHSSYLNFDKALLVHIWRNDKACNRFAQGWQRCWQVLFEHRIRGIHCPMSVVFSIQGVSVTVTALPPVYVDRVPPIHNVFTPFMSASNDVNLYKKSTKVIKSRDVKGCRSPYLSTMLCRLFAVLHLPQDDSVLEQYGDCNLHAGVDGRWYLLQLGPIVCHSTPVLQIPGVKHHVVVRHELLRQMVLDFAPNLAVSPSSAPLGGADTSPATSADFSYKSIHRYILHHAIPKAMSNAVSLLPLGSPESRKPEILIRDGFLPMMLHDHGVNMSYLYFVYEYCMKTAAANTPIATSSGSSPSAPRTKLQQQEDDEDYVAGVPSSKKNVEVQRRVDGGEMDGGDRSGGTSLQKATFYKLLGRTCLMEIMSRTIKSLAKLDVAGGFTTTADFKTSTTVRLDMVNRVARLAASRDQDFLLDHVVPLAKLKFRCPDEFDELRWDVIGTGSLLKVLSVHLGTEYGVHEGRFHSFASFARKKAVLMFPIVPIDAMLSNDERRMAEGVAQLWDDANRIAGKQHTVPSATDQTYLIRDYGSTVLSPMHTAFLARALTFSVLTRTQRSNVNAYAQFDIASIRKGWPAFQVLDVMDILAATEEGRPSERMEQYKTLLLDITKSALSTVDGTVLSIHNPTNQIVEGRDDVAQLSIRLVHVGSLLLRARKPTATYCIRKAIESFVAVPLIDFVYNATHAQALKDVENTFADLDPSGIKEYLLGTVELVVSSLRRWNRLGNAARYLSRVCAAIFGNTLLEEAPESPRVVQLSFSIHSTVFGSHDSRTLLALYMLLLCTLCPLKSPKPAVVQGISNLRKVIHKHNSLSPALQISFGRTNTVQSLITKLKALLEEEHGDSVTLASVKTALYHADRYRNSVLVLQSVGRGFMRRALLVRNGLKTPFSPPQRPSSMVYFDGQVPISLGQAANLGISLEDESTRQRLNANRPGSQQSDVSSVTGSFTSQNSYRPLGRFAKPPAAATPGGSNRPSARLEGSDSNGQGFSLLSPDRVPPQHAGESESSSSLPRVHRPIPRGGAPPLPSGDIPESMVKKVLEYQQQQATVSGRQRDVAPDNEEISITVSPAKDQERRLVPHRGKDVVDAWNFDVPYEEEDGHARHTQQAESHDKSTASPRRIQSQATNALASSQQEFGTSKGTLSQTPQLSRSHDSALLSTDMRGTMQELFALCDKNGDGFATVQECVDVVSKLRLLPIDDLTEALAAVAIKQKKSGITSLFSKPKEVLSIREFEVALSKAGVMR